MYLQKIFGTLYPVQSVNKHNELFITNILHKNNITSVLESHYSTIILNILTSNFSRIDYVKFEVQQVFNINLFIY